MIIKTDTITKGRKIEMNNKEYFKIEDTYLIYQAIFSGNFYSRTAQYFDPHTFEEFKNRLNQLNLISEFKDLLNNKLNEHEIEKPKGILSEIGDTLTINLRLEYPCDYEDFKIKDSIYYSLYNQLNQNFISCLKSKSIDEFNNNFKSFDSNKFSLDYLNSNNIKKLLKKQRTTCIDSFQILKRN